MPQLQTQAGMIRVPAGIWTIDPAHSSVGFKIRHLMIANVRGQFSEFDGTVEAAEDAPRQLPRLGHGQGREHLDR